MVNINKQLRTLFFLISLMFSLSSIAQKYMGGDISLLPKYVTNGAIYNDNNGNKIDNMLTFFADRQMNTMRVRLFVDPTRSSDIAACQDLEMTKALGKQIKDAGFKLMLDIHYSDTWADPAKQWTPNAWTSLTYQQMYDKIYQYTSEVLNAMNAAGATPDFIQTGNEISYGMLWGKSTDSESTLKKCYTSSENNWSYFTNLLKEAGRACREICPQAKIIIHTERVAQENVLTAFYDKMASYNVDYDIIGLSYYPYYHGPLSKLDNALTSLETKFPSKMIMIVEAGYYHAWQPTNIDYDYSSVYPINEEGQKAFTIDLISTLNKHSKVNGLFWWWPEANECGLDWSTKRVSEGWYNAGLWDNSTGKVMSAIFQLQQFVNDPSGISAVTADNQSSKAWYTLLGTKISHPTKKGVYINNNRKIKINGASN